MIVAKLSILLFSGLPPGVVNFVFGVGSKCGAALVRHPDVPIISFTGSTATGRSIIENSAQYFKKLSLEVINNKHPFQATISLSLK